MSIEKLKELLDNGAITQEEFDTMASALEGESEKPAEQATDTAADSDPNKQSDDDKLDRLFQAKFDRAMAQERKEKAELKKKLERLQEKMMSEEEKKQYEFEQQQQELEEQRRELTLEKNKMYAVKSMKKAEIDGSEEAMLLIEKLVSACADESEIDDMIDLLKAWRDKDVAKGVDAEVNRRFKEGGYTPKKSENLNGGVNPFKTETFNLTEQIRLLNTDPETAAKLKAAAGIK